MELKMELNLQTVLTVVMIGAPIVFLLGNIPYISKNFFAVKAAWPIVWRLSLGTLFFAAVSTSLGMQANVIGEPDNILWTLGATLTGAVALMLSVFAVVAIHGKL